VPDPALATLTVRESYRVAFEDLGGRGAASEKSAEPVTDVEVNLAPRGVGR
jgi:hypothetical protein